MNEEQGNYDVRSLILTAIAEQRNSVFLELCYVIYETNDKESLAKKVLTIINDTELIRSVKELEALTEEPENKIYYYEEDTYSNKKLLFKKELENKIRTIRNEQLKNLAKILRELNDEDIEL